MSYREPTHEVIKCLLPGMRCLEIGVKEGNASSLVTNTPIKELYLVDPWTYPIDNYDNQRKCDIIYEEVKDKFKDDNRVKIIRDKWENIIDTLPMFDWILYDVIQTEKEMFTAYNKCWEHLSPNGVLCVSSMHIDVVYNAMKNFLLKHNGTFEIVFVGDGLYQDCGYRKLI
jgi:hypothetical protein